MGEVIGFYGGTEGAGMDCGLGVKAGMRTGGMSVDRHGRVRYER